MKIVLKFEDHLLPRLSFITGNPRGHDKTTSKIPIKRDIFSSNESFKALKLSLEIELKQITKGNLIAKKRRND